MGETK